MIKAWSLVLLTLLASSATRGKDDNSTYTDNDIKDIKRLLVQITRQIITDGMSREERVRAEGDSGIMLVRNTKFGTRPYVSRAFARKSYASMHDHANHRRTVGMGEVTAVINGVQFRTRHNDYQTRMPSTKSKTYHEYEQIKYPNVPKEVLQKETVLEQIAEMQEFFRAFKTQNETHRPYKDYFKPIVCYMEGAWTKDEKNMSEPFYSDRHHIESETWRELLQKVRMMAYTGAKNIDENFAYLPTQIMSVSEDGVAITAQWNYRIMCHPLKIEVPLDVLQVSDDLINRVQEDTTLKQHKNSRSARFTVNPYLYNHNHVLGYRYGLMDKIMEEVPGKDNYLAKLEDKRLNMGISIYELRGNKKKNIGFYHRVFKMKETGEMNIKKQLRGYNDQNMFMAATTREDIMPMEVDVCDDGGACDKYSMRCTWAFPLEIIYLTPLFKWNPLNIEYRGDYASEKAAAVTADNRTGDPGKDKAFNGTHSKLFYRIPKEFFSYDKTTRFDIPTEAIVSVLDRKGVVHQTTASGIRMVPLVGDMGRVRMRYPIAPLHDEGGNTRKELEALKDILKNLRKYRRLLNM